MTAPAVHRFGAHWIERARLPDGTCVQLRMIRGDDRSELARSFARLSATSRYLRFHTARRSLSTADLHYLTEVDGERHVAIVALLADGTGAGIARFIVENDDPRIAEPAVTVVDEFHRRGLGRLLLARLAWAATERGVKRFRASVLEENGSMRALLRGLADTLDARREDDALIVDVPLPALPLARTA